MGFLISHAYVCMCLCVCVCVCVCVCMDELVTEVESCCDSDLLGLWFVVAYFTVNMRLLLSLCYWC